MPLPSVLPLPDNLVGPSNGMTGGSQRRVGCISSRDDTASAQIQVVDPPDPSLSADDAVLLGLLEVELTILLTADLLACAVETADYVLLVSNFSHVILVQMALIAKHSRLALACDPQIRGDMASKSHGQSQQEVGFNETDREEPSQVEDGAALRQGGIRLERWLHRPCCEHLLSKTSSYYDLSEDRQRDVH